MKTLSKLGALMVYVIEFVGHTLILYTRCEGYCRPFFKMVSCINRSSDHDKIFTVYPPIHLLLSSGVHLPARLKGLRQENQRAVIVKIICAV